MNKPSIKPSYPYFSSGPCAKPPGWSLNNLVNGAFSRSHRSEISKSKLKEVIDKSRKLLEIPDDYLIEDLGVYNIFENTVAINFNHRWLSIFVFFYIIFISFKFIKFDNKYVSNILVYLVLFFLTLQVVLGIITLLSNVYLPLASMHQTNSILLLSTLLISYHQIKIRKVKNVK